MEACLDIAAWLEEESLGGVTGGAGMLGDGPLPLPLELLGGGGGSEERASDDDVVCRSRCEPERARGALVMAERFSGCSVCRRMSDSLAAGTTPRLRRNGIVVMLMLMLMATVGD